MSDKAHIPALSPMELRGNWAVWDPLLGNFHRMMAFGSVVTVWGALSLRATDY